MDYFTFRITHRSGTMKHNALLPEMKKDTRYFRLVSFFILYFCNHSD
jgi:hypothetical protein